MIVRARIVVTMAGPPIENGAVAISGNWIVDVGTFDDVKARNSGEVLDLGEQALLPGLINAHCHLDYTCLRGKIPRQKSFTEWIRAINAAKANLSPEDYIASISKGFAEAKRFGTTTIANLTAFPELIGKVEDPIRTRWFAELIDARSPERANEMVELAIESLKSKEFWGLAPHAPYTASEKLYRGCEAAANEDFLRLATHLAESREEMSMFRDASGPLFQFMQEIGRPMEDCGRETPVAHFMRHVDTEAPWLIAHLNELVEDDFELLRRSKPNFHIVHCPRSHEYFGHSPFQFERLRGLGFNVCLGTDSLASNEDLSLFVEMSTFQKEFPDVPPEEILRMVTLNPALSMGKPHVLGQIRGNYFADLIAVPCRGSTPLRRVFEGIVGFHGSVGWSMIGGVVQQAA
jgi:aminodeoxyfutalosine deaminase